MGRTVRKIDELNLLSYKDYFSVMSLTDKQKRERVKAAEEFEDIFLYYLLSLDLLQKYPINPKEDFITEYTKAVYSYLDDDFVPVYVTMLAAMLEETTLRHINEEYYTSLNRAMDLAANEANTVLNRSDYNDAVQSGYRYKQWITEHDDKVRPTHQEVDGLIIPIDELFVVGNAVMPYPHFSPCEYPEEVVNCRCSVKYYK